MVCAVRWLLTSLKFEDSQQVVWVQLSAAAPQPQVKQSLSAASAFALRMHGDKQCFLPGVSDAKEAPSDAAVVAAFNALPASIAALMDGLDADGSIKESKHNDPFRSLATFIRVDQEDVEDGDSEALKTAGFFKTGTEFSEFA
jgi:hypothetical protein